MLDDTAIHAGSLSASHTDRKRFAAFSRTFNRKNPVFVKMFEDLLTEAEKKSTSTLSNSQSSNVVEEEANPPPNPGQNANPVPDPVAPPRGLNHANNAGHLAQRNNAASQSSLFLWAALFAFIGFIIYFLKKDS